MDRRRFLGNLAVSAAAMKVKPELHASPAIEHAEPADLSARIKDSEVHVEDHTLLSTFTRNGETWKVYEDLTIRDGAITFISSAAHALVPSKSAEAVYPEKGPAYLGLNLKDIGLAWSRSARRQVISIEGAPTRWGRVDYKLMSSGAQIIATIVLPNRGPEPRELQVSFRVPKGRTIVAMAANGRETPVTGKNKDAALISTGGQRKFEAVAKLG